MTTTTTTKVYSASSRQQHENTGTTAYLHDRALTRVAILNLPHGLEEEEIREHAQKYGEVKRIHFNRTDRNGVAKDYGFHGYVEFATPREAENAAERMMGLELHGQAIRTEVTKGDEIVVKEPNYDVKLFVGRLGDDMTKERLRAIFEPFGEVTSAAVIVDEFTKTRKGFGFVTLASDAAAQRAVEALHNRPPPGSHGAEKPLLVEFARGENSYHTPMVAPSAYAIPEASMEPANSISFSQLCLMLDRVAAERGVERKLRLIFSPELKRHLKNASWWPIIRLLVPEFDRDRPRYGIKETELGKLICKALGIHESTNPEARRLIHWKNPQLAYTYVGSSSSGSGGGDSTQGLNDGISSQSSQQQQQQQQSRPLPGNNRFQAQSVGNFPLVLRDTMKGYSRNPGETAGLTVGEVNELLQQLHDADNAEAQIPLIRRALENLTNTELMWLARIILKDLTLGVGYKPIMGAYHPDAEAAVASHGDVRRALAELPDPTVRKSFSVELFSPSNVMLASYDRLRPERLTMGLGEFGIEEKYDGERMLVHVERSTVAGTKVKMFTRSAQDYTELYGNPIFMKHLESALDPTVTRVILDGEMNSYDALENGFIDFGSNKTVAKQMWEASAQGDTLTNAWLTYVVFDVLLLERDLPLSSSSSSASAPRSDSLTTTGLPLRDRRRLLEEILHPIEHRIELSPMEVVGDELGEDARYARVMHQLDRVLQRRGEGLVLKMLDSPYVGGEAGRKKQFWRKVKPDYIGSLAEPVDCIVLGGYWSESARKGRASADELSPSSFLLGVQERNPAEPERPEFFRVFCKAATGLTHHALKYVRELLREGSVLYSKDGPQPTHFDLPTAKDAIPNVWYRPEQSIVMEVTGAELVPCSWLSAGFTLRFPRIKRVRAEEKRWYDCTDYETVKALYDRGTLHGGRKRATEITLGDQAMMGGRLRAQKAGAKPTRGRGETVVMDRFGNALAASFTNSSSSAPTGKAFEGRKFFLFAGDAPEVRGADGELISPAITKSELVRLIKDNGGIVLQTAVGSNAYMLAPYVTRRVGGRVEVDASVRNLLRARERDLLRYAFVLDVLDGKCTLEEPAFRDYLCMSDATKTRLRSEGKVDAWGDSFTEHHFDASSLGVLLESVVEAGDGDSSGNTCVSVAVNLERRTMSSRNTNNNNNNNRTTTKRPRFTREEEDMLREEDAWRIGEKTPMRGMRCVVLGGDPANEPLVRVAKQLCVAHGGSLMDEDWGLGRSKDEVSCEAPTHIVVCGDEREADLATRVAAMRVRVKLVREQRYSRQARGDDPFLFDWAEPEFVSASWIFHLATYTFPESSVAAWEDVDVKPFLVKA